MSTFVGFMCTVFLLTKCPTKLNTLSEGTDEAGMAKYYLARTLSVDRHALGLWHILRFFTTRLVTRFEKFVYVIHH